MADIRITDPALRDYLNQREQDLMAEVVSLIKVNAECEDDSLVTQSQVTDSIHATWEKISELRRIKLVLLGEPAPSMEEWMQTLHEAVMDPGPLWEERRQDFVRNRWEMSPRSRHDTASRTYVGYQAVLAAAAASR